MADISVSARKLEGKVAVITGGASGIGERTARLFVEHGARVVVADIQDEAGARLCAELGASYVHCDVTVEDDVAAAVDHAVATFGALDVMFNNAGVAGDAACRGVRDATRADLDRVLAVNVAGPFLGAKHAARVMVLVPARRGGCIVSTASLAASVAGMALHAYTCSKHALVGLTRSLAAELGRHGIRVNCVSPAGVATPLALGYLGMDEEAFRQAVEAKDVLRDVGGGIRKEEDVAAAVLFLASDDARHISGHNLLVDGGISVTVNPSMGIFRD